MVNDISRDETRGSIFHHISHQFTYHRIICHKLDGDVCGGAYILTLLTNFVQCLLISSLHIVGYGKITDVIIITTVSVVNYEYRSGRNAVML